MKLSSEYDGFLFLAEDRRGPPMLKSHRHVELELNLVVSGSVTYIVEDRRYTFPQGSMVWLFPAQEHQLVDRTRDSRYYVAVFRPDMLKRICRHAEYRGLRRNRPHGVDVLWKILNLETFDLLLRTMDAIMVDSLDPDVLNREAGYGMDSDFHFEHGDPDALNAGLHHVLIQSWKAFRTGREVTDSVALHPAVSKAVALLNGDELSLKLGEIARRAGISETYLCRLFKQQVGVPLAAYRNAIRLRTFIELYREPVDRTILECVYAAGFGSYPQFYKVFRKQFGHGPREFLKGTSGEA